MTETKNRYIEKKKKNDMTKRMGKHIHLSIIVYFLILAYLGIIFISFSFSKKTNSTIAEPGQLSEVQSFKGIIIRNEKVINSKLQGSKSYFVKEGERVKTGSLVSVVDPSGEITSTLSTELNDMVTDQLNSIEMTEENAANLKEHFKKYVIEKNKSSYGYTYTAKNEFEEAIFNFSHTIVLDDNELLKNMIMNQYWQNESTRDYFYFAPTSGVVSYYIDGFEDLTLDTFNPSRFNDTQKFAETLASDTTTENEPVYKIIDNYKWNIVAEIDERAQKYLEDHPSVTLHIEDKNMDIPALFTGKIIGDSKLYGVFELSRYMNDFAEQRFVDFTIEYFHWEGIKIPLSAITTKSFYKIPMELLVDNANQKSVMKKVYDVNEVNGESLVSVPLSIYYIKEGAAYIPVTDELVEGDILVASDGSNLNYTLKEIEALEGVYVINKGFASFKLIETLAFNEDYRIIRDDTSFGVCIYDKIASDANTLKEYEVID